MCCQVRVRPVNKAIAAEVLEVGQFSPEPKEPEWPWVRAIPEEGTMVLARVDSGSLMLTLRPGVHTHADHATRRLAASVMFEIAWRYAEKVNGEVWQVANIQKCREERGETVMIARFPLQPFKWDDVCPGFQAVILGEQSLDLSA